ncbi:ATP-binding cassette domain-containing protein [Kineococcus sp. T13]|uniref:ABC transporter ATP-binding protein n=1 Tax=Kineococcus vitellinus TaxID=2696565 RepID=UPI001413016F|nr:ABC transporter ATP-binding protein [Kineococcus vitellinus]NAZ76581.1 ATP-binding cassette domain-containing protein [Kineococcus vitellinus]
MAEPAVRAVALTKRYGSTTAVDDLHLDVPAGQVFGFLGPNGAGKSTTIRMLLGLARPSAGAARIFGVDALDVRRSHRHLAHVPADVALWPQLTGREVLHLLATTGPGTDTAYRDELVERFALDVDKPTRAYSTGNRQKVALVAAFATRAPLLVLDEPTSGLDPLMEQQFRHAVTEARERGQTVFLSSHQLSEVEALCERVGILRAGRLVEVASVAGLRSLHRTEVVASYSGARPRLSALPGVDVVEEVEEVEAVEDVQDAGAGATGARRRVRFTFSGSPAAALRALAEADVHTLAVREPDLEEIFLDYYGGDDDGRGAPRRGGRGSGLGAGSTSDHDQEVAR